MSGLLKTCIFQGNTYLQGLTFNPHWEIALSPWNILPDRVFTCLKPWAMKYLQRALCFFFVCLGLWAMLYQFDQMLPNNVIHGKCQSFFWGLDWDV